MFNHLSFNISLYSQHFTMSKNCKKKPVRIFCIAPGNSLAKSPSPSCTSATFHTNTADGTVKLCLYRRRPSFLRFPLVFSSLPFKLLPSLPKGLEASPNRLFSFSLTFSSKSFQLLPTAWFPNHSYIFRSLL